MGTGNGWVKTGTALWRWVVAFACIGRACVDITPPPTTTLLSPSAFEFIDRACVEVAERHIEGYADPLAQQGTFPFYVVVEASGSGGSSTGGGVYITARGLYQ